MKLLTTGDGSSTLYSEKYGEAYHSVSGAFEESFRKFVEPCGIVPGMRVLDIGFGLGYNVAAALHTAGKLSIVSLEKDLLDVSILRRLPVPEPLLPAYTLVLEAAENKEIRSGASHVLLLIGDATRTLLTLRGEFDAVFLDAFSPKKNPELWTETFFRDVHARMKPGAVLATYSCAGSVRRNLKAAGFLVKDGPVVGRRAPGTLAVRQ